MEIIVTLESYILGRLNGEHYICYPTYPPQCSPMWQRIELPEDLPHIKVPTSATLKDLTWSSVEGVYERKPPEDF